MDPSSDSIAALIALLRRDFGLDLGQARMPVLLEALAEQDRDRARAASALVAGSRTRLGQFAERLTNGETYFLRHPLQIEGLHQEIARSWLKAPPQDFRVWSAGCSTGEEALSLRHMLLELQTLAPGIEVSILATDINSAALAKARKASYSAWSFRGVPPEVRARLFTEHEGRLRPVERLRRDIVFRRHNLLEDSPPEGPFDLVVCRNLLIYFDHAAIQRALLRLTRSVADGGWLLLGPTEVAATAVPELTAVSTPGGYIYQRRDGQQRVEGEGSISWSPAPLLSTEGRKEQTCAPWTPLFADPSPVVAPDQSAADRLLPQIGETAPPAPQEQQDESLGWSVELEQARILADQGRLADARERLQPLLCSNAENGDVRVLMAIVALELGALDEATEHLDAAIEFAPDLAMAHYLRGTVLQAGGCSGDAALAFRHALHALDDLPESAPVAAGGGLTVVELTQVIATLLRMPRAR